MTTLEEPPVPPRLRRAAIVVTAAALAFVFADHLYAAVVTLRRSLSVDEAQYLHAAWLMKQGARLYRDFAEDHAPFLFAILKAFVPERGTQSMPLLDVPAYATRARLFTSACGALALASMVWLVHRATRSLLAPLVTVSSLVASTWLWHHGLADVRNDPPALFLFWLGAALLLGVRDRPLLAGTGIGLAAAAALWNPKMPFECVVLGGVYLWRLRGNRRTALWVIAPAAAIFVATIACIVSVVPFGDYVFFTFEYNRAIGDLVSTETARYFDDGRPFRYCDPAFKGVWPFVLAAAAAVILCTRRIGGVDRQIYAALVALAAAALLDIRFLFPYPNLWSQYYAMWSFALAALYGMTIAALVRATGRFAGGLQIATSILCVVLVVQSLPRSAGSPSWLAREYIQQRLRPGETVWLSAEVHPIAARDASYYWFAFNDLVPASLRYTARFPGASPLPALTEEDLPVCRAERGLEPNLRFVSGGAALVSLPVANACLERMIAAGHAVRVPVRDVWDLRRRPDDILPR